MAEKRRGSAGGDSEDQLRAFLVEVATDPGALGRFVKDPETSMSEAGLPAEDQAVLRSGNPGAINARLAGGPGAAAGGPMMLVVDVAGDQVNVRPLLQIAPPQQVLPLQQVPPLQQVIFQPPLQVQQPTLVFPVAPPPPVWPPPVWPPPPPQIQWPVHPPIWPPPPPQIHWPIHPPPILPIHPPPIWPPPPPPQLVFQQIHPMLVAPGPFGQ